MKTSSAVRAVIYDLDGTLIDSRADLADSINAMLARMGLPQHAPAVIYGFIGEGAERLIRRSLAPRHEDRYGEAAPIWREEYARRLLARTCLYDGVDELLRRAPDARAVLTNKPGEFAGRSSPAWASRKPSAPCWAATRRPASPLRMGSCGCAPGWTHGRPRSCSWATAPSTWRPGERPAFGSAPPPGGSENVRRSRRRIISAIRPCTSQSFWRDSALDSFAAPRERPSAERTFEGEAVPDSVRISAGKQELELPVVQGSEGERGIDITNLRAKAG